MKMSCFDEVAMSCIVYMVNCNFVIYVSCPLAFTMYKYSELQMSLITQKLSYKANCKTHLFFHNDNPSFDPSPPFLLYVHTWFPIIHCYLC
jgi:hypothetical protein